MRNWSQIEICYFTIHSQVFPYGLPVRTAAIKPESTANKYKTDNTAN